MYIPNGCEIYQKIHSKACKNVPKCIGIIGMQKYHLATQVQTFFSNIQPWSMKWSGPHLLSNRVTRLGKISPFEKKLYTNYFL
jgi:hypothetical protein